MVTGAVARRWRTKSQVSEHVAQIGPGFAPSGMGKGNDRAGGVNVDEREASSGAGPCGLRRRGGCAPRRNPRARWPDPTHLPGELPADLCCNRLAACRIEVEQSDRRAPGGKGPCHRFAKPGGAAGEDDGGLARNLHLLSAIAIDPAVAAGGIRRNRRRGRAGAAEAEISLPAPEGRSPYPARRALSIPGPKGALHNRPEGHPNACGENRRRRYPGPDVRAC